VFSWTQLDGELVVEWQIDDLSVVDANCEYCVMTVLISDCEVVVLLGWQKSKVSRVYSLLLELRLLRLDLFRCVLVINITQNVIFDFEVFETFYIGG
jgi:hypothetical protein